MTESLDQVVRVFMLVPKWRSCYKLAHFGLLSSEPH